MQIRLHKTKPKGTGVVEVRLLEKGAERLVRIGKREILEIPFGKLGKVKPRTLRIHIRGIVQTAKRYKVKKLCLVLEQKLFPKCKVYGTMWFWSMLAENLLLADYEYTAYKSRRKNESLEVHLISKDPAAKEGLERGKIIAEYVNACRDIANTPGGDMTPRILGEKAKSILKGTKTKVTVLSVPAIRKLKMGGLLGVGKGAAEEPRFIIIEHYGGVKHEKPLVFVGKGITFDTGGLQVKPGMAMYEMHMDMSGGASVIAAIGAIAKLGIKKNVIGLIPAAENAISDKAIRPGDVLTMMSGATVDVLHTDAEGRLVLADALHYAKRFAPSLVVDIATLTGAALVALGQHAHIIMTKNRKLEDRLRDLGEESGDYVFPLPLWDEYKQYLKGVHGDIANIAQGDLRFGGTIHAGIFLSHFTKGMTWAHIDMAPRMTSVQSDKLAKGATGEPTRLLIALAEHWEGKAA